MLRLKAITSVKKVFERPIFIRTQPVLSRGKFRWGEGNRDVVPSTNYRLNTWINNWIHLHCFFMFLYRHTDEIIRIQSLNNTKLTAHFTINDRSFVTHAAALTGSGIGSCTSSSSGSESDTTLNNLLFI